MGTLSSTRPVPENYNPKLVRDLVARVKRKEKPQKTCASDGFPVYADDPLRESHLLLEDYFREAGRAKEPWRAKPAGLKTGRAILDTPTEQWPAHLRAGLARTLYWWTHSVKEDKRNKMWRWDYNTALFPLKPL